MSVSVKNLKNIIIILSVFYGGTSNTFPNIPIPPPKRRRSAIQRIRHGGALDDGPATQDGEAGPEGAGVVVFSIGEDLAEEVAEGGVVFLDEEFLEAEDVRGVVGEGLGYGGDAGVSEGRDVEEAPDV